MAQINMTLLIMHLTAKQWYIFIRCILWEAMKSKLTTLNVFRGDVDLLEALIIFLLFMLIHAIYAYCN